LYFRRKTSGGCAYLQIAESRRDGDRVRQQVIATLGRFEELQASDQLERLVRSGARIAAKAMVLSAAADDAAIKIAVHRIGPALVSERLWEETRCRAVNTELAAKPKHGFALERAVFLTVLYAVCERLRPCCRSLARITPPCQPNRLANPKPRRNAESLAGRFRRCFDLEIATRMHARRYRLEKSPTHLAIRLGAQAAGGVGLFVFVLWWWRSFPPLPTLPIFGQASSVASVATAFHYIDELYPR
jgi:hypothetical protein